MKNTTNRQIFTLFILVCILIIVIAVQYFFRPVIRQKNKLSEQIEDMQSEYDDVKMNALIYKADLSVYQKNKKALDDNRKQLLPLMKSNELDNMITKIFSEKGLSIDSLDISEIKSDTVSMQYKDTQKYESEDFEEAEDIENEKTDDKQLDLSVYPDGAKTVTDKNERILLEYQTGEYSCQLRYNASGTYKNILDLVNEISKNNSLQVNSVYFTSTDTVSPGCIYQADILITAYMYDSPD